ncbi:BatA domain-containing protein [Limnoglobus roseus]|uniref:VWA domain-containing protein n=1 Tax=Limnoglobus roseus TaxID=2598579 RepID=A0A5C1A6Y6_9BACT|nr:BatA domain-containing protein [Limnoglobus roseus]QEL14023.1 VWA domain-containing protein [Limnoglobus roseus]
MFESFLNPWSFFAGVALVSVPIIIHLINRMRFKRVRWAAMEFIIKAQKKMKRKLIFQQLLLLFLRCLMVFLIGLLVGRFVGFNPLDGRETRTTSHVVIFDDSPSMGDFFRGDDGQLTDAFGEAKKVLVDQIAPAAAQAATAQTLEVMMLSTPQAVKSFERVNNTSIEEMKTHLNGFAPSPVRGSLVEALKLAKKSLDTQAGNGEVSQVIHVLSDFRATDWEADGEKIKTAVTDLTTAKVKVHLVDVAHPFRKDEKQAPLHHDNISIVELKPAKLVTARYEALEFTLRVRNNGPTELKDVRFPIAVNGDDGKGQSVQIPTLPGNDERSIKFLLTFDRVGTADKPLDRFSLVTARLESPEPGGLVIDNVRHAVVEVRDRLPMLVIDGRPADREKKEGDGFYLQRLFTDAIGGFKWVPGSLKDLEGDLRPYTCVLMLNVPAVPEAAAKNLESYVRDGGGLGFFLGPDVKPGDYNKTLYADGNGVFPVPLPEQPSAVVPEEVKLVRRFSPTKKILLRDPAVKGHPAVAAIYNDDRGQPLKNDELERFFRFVYIDRYWPVKRIGKWREDRSVSELFCMPNESPMGEYDKPTIDFLNKLPLDEPKYAKYKPQLDDLKVKIRAKALSSDPLYELAMLFDQLLADQRAEGGPAEAQLREFWAQPEVADLKAEAGRLRDLVKFGDPLYFAKAFGKGRVTVITTTAGETWTDWASAPPGNTSFPPIMTELERYLSGGTAEANRLVGEPLSLKFDETRYKPVVARWFLGFDPLKDGVQRAAAALAPADLKEQTMSATGGQLDFQFADATKPGGYLFTFTQLKSQSAGSDAAEVPEYVGAAFNVDAATEGDLRRSKRDEILKSAPGAELHSVGDADWTDVLKNKKSDWSEGGWLFLVLLLVLIVEHALAVKLSYNSSSHADHSAPTVAAMFNRTAVPTAKDETPTAA